MDFDVQDAYHRGSNLNQYVSVFASMTTQIASYPALNPGTTFVTLDEGITSVEITPRWWTL